jgi:hypothetical protein
LNPLLADLLERLRQERKSVQSLRKNVVDPDLAADLDAVLAATGIAHPALVWDVHEDTAAALTLRPWMPRPRLSRPLP